MTTLPVYCPTLAATQPSPFTIALIGNPNTGKTTLFNRLTGLRAKTANFPGTTLERRVGSTIVGGRRVVVEDLPGLYGLSAGSLEERVARDALLGTGGPAPAAVVVVVDQMNLARNLYLASQVRDLGVPMVIALNMSDLAEREGLGVDAAALSGELGAPVVAVSARTGEGLSDLRVALENVLASGGGRIRMPVALASSCSGCTGCGGHAARFDWAEDVAARASRGSTRLSAERTARIDRVLTHPVAGLLAFAMVMAAFFIAIFGLAEYPMTAIEGAVGALGEAVGSRLPEGDSRSLVVDGVIGGVGGVLVFLPQICVLFFLLSLLEDSGYLARAAFVMDRLMGKVGLPGKAFVPMLSAHACAIPALMASRVIEDRRDRLVSMLVLPLFTCSARLPVYAMVTSLLCAGRPVQGGLLFAGAYALGIAAALGSAWAIRRTLVPGESRPLLLELPTYKVPSLLNAFHSMRDRGAVFLTKAGTVILAIAMGMWALSTYPKLPDERLGELAPAPVLAEIRALQAEGSAAAAAQADALTAPYRLEYALAGRIGKLMEPVFRPLGFDWRINIGILSSFAARETLVSTLAVVYGVADEGGPDSGSLRAAMRAQRRPDGTPVFGLATACSLLVFFVLAMQCLPTLAVSRRETGSWRWPAFQFGAMTVLAYTAAFAVHEVVSRLGPIPGK